MTECCNDYGKCDLGKDCPARNQRMKETDDRYIQSGGWGRVNDPIDDLADIFKALILVIAVTAAFTLLAFVIWGK
jgi:hypothetical protein